MTSTNTWRGGGGRFQQGNPGGPGRPRGRRNAAAWAAFDRTVTDEVLGQVLAAMVEAAKGGDVSAARVVLDRSLPTAAHAVVEEEPEKGPAADYSRLSKEELETLSVLIRKATGRPRDGDAVKVVVAPRPPHGGPGMCGCEACLNWVQP